MLDLPKNNAVYIERISQMVFTENPQTKMEQTAVFYRSSSGVRMVCFCSY